MTRTDQIVWLSIAVGASSADAIVSETGFTRPAIEASIAILLGQKRVFRTTQGLRVVRPGQVAVRAGVAAMYDLRDLVIEHREPQQLRKASSL